ncbi:MAG: MmgE/PrpD family protein, partial [Comamonadaceae bacterium]
MTHSDPGLAAAASTVSSRLAAFSAGFALEQVPAAVQERAKHLMLDSLGIALACTRWDFARATLAGLRELAGPGGDVPVIGHGENLPLRDAVAMNALLIHGLDYDDTHPAGVIHATTSVLPASLALATRLGASGADLLAAYVLGMETTTRLGAAAKGGFHQVGFHPTGLIGTFGCTLAAARLLGMSEEATVQAQGVALSLASGSLEFLQDGAWTKRLHPGWAGAAGITAATLAKNGFIGPRAAYEGRFGLYNSHLGPLAAQCDLSLITQGLGTTWETENVAIKPVPACHFTHACADAASLLHADWNDAPIRRIVARVPAGVMKTVCEPIENKRRPANAYEAQFSIPYSVAVGLRFGRFTLDALEPAAYGDPKTL